MNDTTATPTYGNANDRDLVAAFERWCAYATGEQQDEAQLGPEAWVTAARAVAAELRQRSLFADVVAGMSTEGQDWLIDNRI